jgi:nitroreductase
MYAARGCPPHLTKAQFRRLMSTGGHLWDHMGEAPVILLPCMHQPVVPPAEALSPEMRAHHQDELAYAARIRGSSIYPAVQNIILACRGLGLGTTITTNHLRCENEVRALLGLPDDVDTFAMMPIGWPVDAFGLLSRKPLAEVVHADRWGNAWRDTPR